MLRRLLARLCHVDWSAPWTSEPRGGGPALDRELEERIRRDERARHITQADTAHGHDRKLRIGDYFPDGKVPR